MNKYYMSISFLIMNGIRLTIYELWWWWWIFFGCLFGLFPPIHFFYSSFFSLLFDTVIKWFGFPWFFGFFFFDYVDNNDKKPLMTIYYLEHFTPIDLPFCLGDKWWPNFYFLFFPVGLISISFHLCGVFFCFVLYIDF